MSLWGSARAQAELAWCWGHLAQVVEPVAGQPWPLVDPARLRGRSLSVPSLIAGCRYNPSFWRSNCSSGAVDLVLEMAKLPDSLGASVSVSNRQSSNIGVAGDLLLYSLVAPGDQPIVADKGVCLFDTTSFTTQLYQIYT